MGNTSSSDALQIQPRLLTKKWLRAYFEIKTPDYGGRLRTLVFTDEVLQRLGWTNEDYLRIRTFTQAQSVQIREVLQIPDPQ